MKLKKIFIAIVAFLIIDLMKTFIHNYGFNNAGNNSLVILTGLLSLSLSVIFVVILAKLFSKKR